MWYLFIFKCCLIVAFVEVKSGLFKSSKIFVYLNGLTCWQLEANVVSGMADARKYVTTLPAGTEFIIKSAYAKHDSGTKLYV